MELAGLALWLMAPVKCQMHGRTNIMSHSANPPMSGRGAEADGPGRRPSAGPPQAANGPEADRPLPGSVGLRAFRGYLSSYVTSARFTALAGNTRDEKSALRQIRYCTGSTAIG